jgi:hypothetical protein
VSSNRQSESSDVRVVDGGIGEMRTKKRRAF